MSDLARLDAELKEYELAYQMTTPDFLLRVADPHDDLSDVEDASFWRATYEIAEKIRTEGDNTVSDLVARLRTSFPTQLAFPTRLESEAANRIEALEAELAEAKAKIARVKEVADKNGRMTADLFRNDKPAYALYGYFEASIRIALESATPKPTDNGGKG